jgi:hypothetical protein
MKIQRLASYTLASLAFVPVAAAADRWETTFLNLTDDTASTPNFLRHGTVQTQHDLEGNPDEDWMSIRVKDGHSYEARVTSDTVYWDPACGTPECPRFDRVTAAGAVLTAGTVTNDGVGGFDLGPGQGLVSFGLGVRWISTTDGKEYLRARGDSAGPLPAGLVYTVEFLDTTYFIPRWNNTSTQTTVFIVQNASNASVAGNILLHNAAGGVLHSQPFTIPQFGVAVFNTASVAALAGQSGSARIVHTGGYGALAGKAVALEPGTGFSFDTPMQPLPR